MDTRVFITLLLVAVATAQDLSFECETLRPKDQGALEQHSFPPFAIWPNDTFIGKGEALKVTLKRMVIGGSMSRLKSFVVQARLIGKTYPIGTWEIEDGVPAEGHNCPGGTEGPNTLSHKDLEDGEQKSDIIATWRAPADLAGTFEFLGTFVKPDDTYFFNINSYEVNLAVKEGDTVPTNNDNHRGPDVFSNADPHQTLKEAELAARFKDHQMQEIQNEDKYSEGDWQRRAEEERRQHEENIRKEMEMYEKQKADEERIRMERIRAEMLDKEEHDRLAWENEHKGDGARGEFDKPQNDENIITLNEEDDTETVNAKETTSGAAVVTSGVLAAILAAIAFARRN